MKLRLETKSSRAKSPMQKKSSGISLMESIIVIAIIGILAAVAVASLANSKNRNVLTDSQTLLVRTLEDARARAMSGVGNNKYGVTINTNSIILFQNTSTGSSTISNLSFPSVITASTTPSPLSITFTRISGTSTASTTIVLKSSITNTRATTTVTFGGQIFPY